MLAQQVLQQGVEVRIAEAVPGEEQEMEEDVSLGALLQRHLDRLLHLLDSLGDL